ncbi:hypothetical protein MHYP_G00324940 [Metynnis hypsauchen]
MGRKGVRRKERPANETLIRRGSPLPMVPWWILTEPQETGFTWTHYRNTVESANLLYGLIFGSEYVRVCLSATDSTMAQSAHQRASLSTLRCHSPARPEA